MKSGLSNMKQCLWPILLLAIVLISTAAKPVKVDLNLDLTTEKDPVKLASLKNDKEVLVLVFVSSSCPVTTLYWDRLKGLWYNYREKDIKFVFVGSNSDDSISQLRGVLKDRGLELPLVWDPNHRLAQSLGLEFTPTAAVFGRNWEALYVGRIDDSWRHESRVKQRYLDDAINAALENRKSPSQAENLFMGSRMR
jgi:peroxiredoxin